MPKPVAIWITATSRAKSFGLLAFETSRPMNFAKYLFELR